MERVQFSLRQAAYPVDQFYPLFRFSGSGSLIDTSILRVHQHAACIARNRRQSMGRSRGGLTSKIDAVVDSSGLPVRLALTTGEAHDNRLAAKLLSRLKSG
jgi:hypothetical protein